MSEGVVLLIDVCAHSLHSFEFVRPIEDILRCENIGFKKTRFNQIDEKMLKSCDAVIVCGTSLLDNRYLQELDRFSFLKSFDKPVLGICAGMQILVKIFNGTLLDSFEIGLTNIELKKEFFGLKDEVQVYELHQYSTIPDESVFEVVAVNSKGVQIIAHREKQIVGVIFHPEVRNKEFIIHFLKNQM